MLDVQFINEPNPDLFLYKFVKSNYIDDFLEGKLYMSALSNFEEFYEGIDYRLFICNYLERWSLNQQFKKKAASLLAQNYSASIFLMKTSWLKDIIKINESILNESQVESRLFKILEDKINLVNEHKNYQQKTYANCWFSTNNASYEPYLMWKNYSDKNGILFKTNYRYLRIHLLNSLIPSLESSIESNFKVSVGLVKYRDMFDKECWNSNETNYHRGFFKEDSFKDENEFRVLIELENKSSNKIYMRTPFSTYLMNGTIVLHPESDYSQINLIKDKIKNKINLNFEISKHSNIVTATKMR